jgi:nucleoside-diphosphate-sugar epimerase
LNCTANRQINADRRGRAGKTRGFRRRRRTGHRRPCRGGRRSARRSRSRPEAIFHLAGVVSGEAETDFEKGYHVNLDGTRALLEAIRLNRRLRLQAESGFYLVDARCSARPSPMRSADDFHLTPLTSYGTAKSHQRIAARRLSRAVAFSNGVGIRLPTICVRPGKPNKAASGFLLRHHPRTARRAQDAVLPVEPTASCHTHASPRSAVGFLIHAAGPNARSKSATAHQP